ncbi:MAG: DUF2344 domain-containing protein [Ruminococcaceae bacterium]|nr:DUF2344 domain-containing protein [Oscillospiraceae bacterium]
MLSDVSTVTNKLTWAKAYPMLETPRTVRMQFVKVGDLQYISHLDLQRAFYRIIKRAGIPVWYTKGFNPHAKMTFSTPLSVGTQSVCECMDLRIERDVPCDVIRDRMNAELTDLLYINEVYIPEEKFSEIAYAEYTMHLTGAWAGEETAQRIQALLTTSPLVMTKKSKAGEKEIDIVPLIAELSVRYDVAGGQLVLNATLSAGADSFLNPEMLIGAIRKHLGLLAANPLEEYYDIMRTSLLRQDMTRFR